MYLCFIVLTNKKIEINLHFEKYKNIQFNSNRIFILIFLSEFVNLWLDFKNII